MIRAGFENSSVIIAASTLKEGTMKFGAGEPNEAVLRHRTQFLHALGLSLQTSVLCNWSNEPGTIHTRTREVTREDSGKGMQGTDAITPADAWFTKERDLGLFLPVADCGGVVVYDAAQKVLGMLHLGRHATFDNLAQQAIEHMKSTYDTNPQDVHIWISPSISGDSYWLHTFDRADLLEWQGFYKQDGDGYLVDLQAYNISRFIAAGVPAEQIEHTGIDTATHADFPSHYRHVTHGDKQKAGRFAVVASMGAL